MADGGNRGSLQYMGYRNGYTSTLLGSAAAAAQFQQDLARLLSEASGGGPRPEYGSPVSSPQVPTPAPRPVVPVHVVPDTPDSFGGRFATTAELPQFSIYGPVPRNILRDTGALFPRFPGDYKVPEA